MGSFGLLASANYSLMTVTSLTRLNCKSPQCRHSTNPDALSIFQNDLSHLLHFMLYISASSIFFFYFVLSLVWTSDTGRISNGIHARIQIEKEVVLYFDFLAVEAEGSKRNSNRATVSIDKTRADDGFIRVKVFNSQVSGKSVTRPACQRSLVFSTRRLVYPTLLHDTHGNTGESAKSSLSEPLARRDKTRAMQMSHPGTTPLARRYSWFRLIMRDRWPSRFLLPAHVSPYALSGYAMSGDVSTLSYNRRHVLVHRNLQVKPVTAVYGLPKD